MKLVLNQIVIPKFPWLPNRELYLNNRELNRRNREYMGIAKNDD